MTQLRESLHFNTKRQLQDWLNSNGVDLVRWGKGNNKSVDNLWFELLSEDCTLTSGPNRLVKLAVILIKDQNRILCEYKQELKDGRVRIRNKPPREKIRCKETVRDGVIRCLKEELSLNLEDFQIIDINYQSIPLLKESDSYSGLKTLYAQYFVAINVPSIPKVDFSTEELGTNDPVLRHWWTWINSKELNLPVNT